MGLPIRRRDFDTQGFLAFLAENGCEIGKPSNPYEVVRYRAYWEGSKRPITHLVYAKETGLLTWMHGSQAHYRCFLEGAVLHGNKPPFESQFDRSIPAQRLALSPKSPRLSQGAITREKLLARDGDDCWFCGLAMGDDCTIEHLVPKSKRGANHPDNYALAHKACNHAAADMPLVEKIAMRERLRADAMLTERERG